LQFEALHSLRQYVIAVYQISERKVYSGFYFSCMWTQIASQYSCFRCHELVNVGGDGFLSYLAVASSPLGRPVLINWPKGHWKVSLPGGRWQDAIHNLSAALCPKATNVPEW